MANYNLTNQSISSSFQQLLQKNDTTGLLVNGTGSVVTDLEITGSLTASFFKGDGSGLTNITSSVPPGTVSGSSQIILTQTTGNLGGNRITGSVASATLATNATYVNVQPNAINSNYYPSFTNGTGLNTTVYIDTTGYTYNPSQNRLTVGSLSATSAITASVSVTSPTFYGDLDGNALTATNATYSQNTITTGKNLHSSEIQKGTPLFFTGSGTSGNLVGILPADAGNPARMPAGGIAGETIAVGAEGVVLIDGYIGGVDTSLFQSGDEVFVGVGGGYTNVAPTGSNNLIQKLGNVEKAAVNGSGVINGPGATRSVPNIQQGYIWVGNSDGVATATSTGSFAKTNENNTFTGNQTFNDITVNGTGSFAYIQSVTGSAKIIGDAFIILNNDLPTERYAGIVVQDSGSGSPLTTASLEFDGLTNDWFYEYSTDGGVTTDHGVVLFGPEYGTKGTPTYPSANVIQKGTGGHHLTGSNISDDGSTVTINAPLQVSSAATYDISVVGSVKIGNANSSTLFVSSSSANVNVKPQSVKIAVAGGGGVDQSSAFGNYFSAYTSDFSEIAIGANGGAYTSNWSQGPFLSVNDPGDSYPAMIGFQNKSNWTDGHMTFLYPAKFNDTIIGDVTFSDVGTTAFSSSVEFGNNVIFNGTTFDIKYAELTITGSIKNNVNGTSIVSQTASLDFSQSSMFQLTLASGVDTHIDATNVGKGQTINLLVTQDATSAGTVSFSPKFLQPSGSSYTPSAFLGGQDILTFVTFNDTSKIYTANVKDLS